MVYLYGENEVIKFSQLARFPHIRGEKAEERDIVVGKKFLGEFMLDTRVVYAPNGSQKALLQTFVSGRILKKDDLVDPGVKTQFNELVRRHTELVAAGYPPVDLMSGVGFLLSEARNIFLLDTKEVRVIDVTLVDMLSLPLRKLVMHRQETILLKYKQNTA